MTYSPSDIETTLEDDPYFVKAHPAEEWTIPEINLDLWRDDPIRFFSSRADAEEALSHFVGYLQRPYLEDTFENNHWGRTDWQAGYTADENFNNFFNNDALEGGFAYFHLGGHLITLEKGYLGNRASLGRELQKVEVGLPPKHTYDLALTFAEKRQLMSGLKKNIHTLLQHLVEQSR